MEYPKEKPESVEEELIDFIYKKKGYIFEYYSIYELIDLIRYAKNDKSKILYLLDNYSKEENMETIEKTKSFNYLANINSNHFSKNKLLQKIEKYIIKSKTIEQIEENKNKLEENNIVWNFIFKQGTNFVDLYDALNSFDKVKLYDKIMTQMKEKGKKNFTDKKDKLISAVNLELNKVFENKESKIYEKYLYNFEENDIYYLKKTGQWNYYSKFSNPKKSEINNDKIDKKKLYEILIKMPKSPRGIIFSFIDIFTLGKLALCNKILYHLIFNEFNLNQNTTKMYLGAIFANSELYKIDAKKIKSLYKNNPLEMFKKKQRIKFCGIYYARVKIISEFYRYGLEQTNTGIIIYYRILRFFPNGEIYAMTCPYLKSNKIKQGLKEGNIEFKKGKFKIDEEDKVLVTYSNGDEYEYKLGWSDFSIYRLGFKHDDPGVKSGIELIKYNMVDKFGEKTNIKLDENFPKRFRFRNLECLKNDIYIHKIEEFMDDDINDKKIDFDNDKNMTLSTEENSINEINL